MTRQNGGAQQRTEQKPVPQYNIGIPRDDSRTSCSQEHHDNHAECLRADTMRERVEHGVACKENSQKQTRR